MASHQKNLEIQALRGVAILLTLFHHIPIILLQQPPEIFFKIYSHFTFWSGVDLFFVISGFVITLSILRLKTTNDIKSTIILFFKKRFVRILPPAWIWLAVYLLFTYFWNASGSFGELISNINYAKSAVLQYANIYQMKCGTGPGEYLCGPNQIYWSLSIEEQFYIIIPFVILFLKKRSWLLLLPLALLQIFWARPEWSLGWSIRSDALLIGSLLAMFGNSGIYKRIYFVFEKFKYLGFVFFVASIPLICFLPARQNNIKLGTGLVAIICSINLLIASSNKNLLIPFFRLRRVLILIGERSYSLYLTHVISYCAAVELYYQMTPTGYRISTNDTLALLTIGLSLSFIFAEFSYRLIERPLSELAQNFK